MGGTLTIGATDTVSLAGGATLKAKGVSGDLTNTSGTFSPGASPALVSLDGNYTQLSGGTLELELAGTTAGTQYDVLAVDGNIDLAGTVKVTLLDGFMPTIGDSFTVITRSGSFTDSGYALNLPSLTSGRVWDTSAFATSGVLAVVTAVPEPHEYGLLGAGVLALAAYVRRRHRTGLQ